MNRFTGHSIAGLEHLRQSVGDILTTPIGTRVMRRDYGSLVPDLIDHPDTQATQIRLFSAIASALMRWEPRMRLSRVLVAREADKPGRLQLTLEGTHLNEYRRQQPLSLQLTVTGRRGGAA
ncbi:GPW/gp25 family protein [Acidovorax sp. LjRoot129]|uniref:GPW/gp25 family protein n=1 Tax=Acidovorax sp. LjRoot129 TaxID=3342260 RepID=UPI003ECDD4AF